LSKEKTIESVAAGGICRTASERER